MLDECNGQGSEKIQKKFRPTRHLSKLNQWSPCRACYNGYCSRNVFAGKIPTPSCHAPPDLLLPSAALGPRQTQPFGCTSRSTVRPTLPAGQRLAGAFTESPMPGLIFRLIRSLTVVFARRPWRPPSLDRVVARGLCYPVVISWRACSRAEAESRSPSMRASSPSRRVISSSMRSMVTVVVFLSCAFSTR